LIWSGIFRQGEISAPFGAPKADKIEALFIENNPGLDADEIYLSCTENGPKKSSNTLDEVRICVDKDTHEFTRCEKPRYMQETQKSQSYPAK